MQGCDCGKENYHGHGDAADQDALSHPGRSGAQARRPPCAASSDGCGAVVAFEVLGGECTVDCHKEGADFLLVEPAVRAHAGTEINPIGTHLTDGVRDIRWGETASEKHRHLDGVTDPAANMPI